MSEIINTKRLTLRPFTRADESVVLDYLGDFEVSRWLGRVAHPFTQDDIRIVNEDGSSRWPDLIAITLNSNVIGAVSSASHLGYWLAKPFWRSGYTTEAARAVVDYVFENTDRADIGSGYFEGNQGSAKILHNLGFAETHRRLNHCLSQKCELPHVDLILTRERWKALA